MIEKSLYMRRSLRRHTSTPCDKTAVKHHDTTIVVDEYVPALGLSEGAFLGDADDETPDPRWPRFCLCGYRFHLEDHWQVIMDTLYAGFPDRKLYSLRDNDLPIGAMWASDMVVHKGPDGAAWCLRLPGGIDWSVYSPSSNGVKWDVRGVPPSITVSPSIHMPGVFHGFVISGVIQEDCDGRKFEGIPRTA